MLIINAPDRVAIGAPIEITLTARHIADVAGYETALLFDTTVAEFGGLEQRQNDLKKIGRDVSPVAAIDLPSGVAFGLYSCPVANCVTRQGPRRDRGANGTVRLVTVTLYPNEPGSLEIRLDATKFVDADGNPVDVAISNPAVTVQVGSGGPSHPAPGSMWTLASSAPPDPGPFDLTGDGLVTHADAMEVAIEWELTRLDVAPCGALPEPSRDVNHDGCIDVADLQLVAAHYSNNSADNTAPAGDQPENNQVVSGEAAASLTLTVNSTGDAADSNIGNGVCATSTGVCTLRAAIQEANARSGADTIVFNIAGSGVQTIKLSTKLPTLNDATGGTTIDGYTQPGASPNTDSLISNAVIKVQIEGGGESNFDGFVITSSGNIIRGLAVYKMQRSFWIRGSGATNNRITGTFVGTNAAGTYGAAGLANIAHGFHIEQGASSNHVGGTAPAERNVISGNARHGLGIWHEQSDGNVVRNNIIGLTPSGNNRLPNRKHGLDLNFGSASNTFGGTGAGERNVCSGNDDTGIEISHTAGTTNNSIIGNYIGTDVTGTQATSYSYNGGRGIMMEDGVSNNILSGNVIGNNRQGGIEIAHSYTVDNQILNNRVGVGVNGSNIGNNRFGIMVNGSHNKIGPNNIIANNQFPGFKIERNDADYNTITRNAIYNNGALGIDLFPSGVTANDSGDTDSGPNDNLNFPILNSATTQQVTGTVCGGCTVEIFIADSGAGAHGEGRTFVGSATASGGGAFTANVSGVQAGQVVTATATDGDGNTSEFSRNLLVSSGGSSPTPTPTPTPGPTATPTPTPSGSTTHASDSFSRTVVNGWGSANVGGSYTLSGTAANYDVNGTAGTISIPSAGSARKSTLGSVSALDVNVIFRVHTDKLAGGNSEFAYFIARRVSSNTEYRGQIRFAPNNTVHLRALRIDNGSSAALGSGVKVNGLTHTVNSYIWVRGQVIGTNPTTIRLKAWADGQTEPANWQYSVTDSTASLQTAGSVGLMANLPSNVTNAPVLFTFDDFLVTAP